MTSSSSIFDSNGFVNEQSAISAWDRSVGTEATKTEFQTFMASSAGLSAADADKVFTKFDTDGNGALTKAEYLDGFYAADNAGNKSGKTTRSELSSYTGVTFSNGTNSTNNNSSNNNSSSNNDTDSSNNNADSNNCSHDCCQDGDQGSDNGNTSSITDSNGFIDMDKAKSAFNSAGGTEATETEFNTLLDNIGIEVTDPATAFAKFDTDGNKAISQAEFLDGLYAADNQGNKSGKTTLDELKKYMNG